eukprot:scaffold70971_cov74-Phaeocystis_antarctica.AAC.8
MSAPGHLNGISLLKQEPPVPQSRPSSAPRTSAAPRERSERPRVCQATRRRGLCGESALEWPASAPLIVALHPVHSFGKLDINGTGGIERAARPLTWQGSSQTCLGQCNVAEDPPTPRPPNNRQIRPPERGLGERSVREQLADLEHSRALLRHGGGAHRGVSL